MAKGFGKNQNQTENKKGQKTYRAFLDEILFATANSRKNPQLMFCLIEENYQKLNDGFVEFLQHWLKLNLAKESLKVAELRAKSIIDFSLYIGEFPRGDIEINIEIAIAGIEAAITFFKRDFFPEEWGLCQKNIASFYRRRIRGDKAENLEKAIAACQKALQVLTRDIFPKKWAMTQNTLGLVYSDRIKGDISENQEIAISCYKAALEVFNREVYAREWGRLQHNLGLAYKRRIKGNLRDNQETAIAYYEAALEVRTRAEFPEKWAQTQADLGIVYSERILGNPRENIDRAIAYYQAALAIYIPTLFPIGFSFVETLLLAAYKLRDDLEQGGKEIAFILQIFQVIHKHILLPESQENLIPTNTMPEVDELLIESGNSNSAMGNFTEEKAFYAFISANLEKLDDNFIQLFRNWATVKLSAVDGDEAKYIEISIFFFSILMQKFSQGNIAINLEIAITGYEILSPVFSEGENSANKLMKAQILNNLSFAYTERIYGNKAENLEKAISLGETALKIVTPHKDAFLWANLQNNLGGAYSYRIKGDKAENLEKTIQHFTLASEVFTREYNPFLWAGLKHNIGDAYGHRMKGDRLENMELAIKYIEASLEVYTKENFPKEWANNQNTLGFIYSERVRGDRQENLEKTIEYYQRALQIFTPHNYPEFYGKTKMNLANTYRDRLKGNSVKNLEIAIATYHNVLEVFTQEAFPDKWASTQNNLGMAYSNQILGNPSENQELAIKSYEAALQIYTEEKFPREWGMTQKNLGVIYANFIKGNSSENFEKAMTFYQAAGRVFTYDSFPKYWARNQYNMAATYIKLEKINEAIACYQSALKIFTPKTFTMDCFSTGRILGDLSFKTNRWEEAIQGYGIAIDAVETSRSWITSESRRQAIMENVIDVYFNMVQACINADNLEKALEYAERSKSKRLVDLMASNDLSQGGELSPEVQELLQQYDDLQQKIDQQHHQKSSDNNRTITKVGTSSSQRASLNAYNEKVAHLEAEKQKIWEQLRKLDPVLAGEIQVSPPDITAIQKFIDKPTTAILSFYNTADNTYIFVLRQNQISLHTCSQQGMEILQPWIYESWLLPYLPGENETKQQKEERQSKWYEQMNDILAEIGERLQLDRLITEYLNGIEELILIPHLYLHLIPFAAIPISVPTLDAKDVGTLHETSLHETSLHFGDKFLIRYAPSCQILEFCHQRGELETATWQYGIVENAEDNLPFAGFEGEQISKLFNIPETNRLRGKTQATRSNYQQLANTVQLLHSCHHAESRFDKPLESLLKLSDGNITLGQLMSPGWRLPKLSDVFLSCCETGLGTPQITDDILTLATGFLCAGARSVINTLWSVDDFATALVAVFYYEERQLGKSRPQALWEAQIKLRGMTKEEVRKLLSPVKQKRAEAKDKRDQYPANSPEYQEWHRQYCQYSSVYSKILDIQNKNPFSHPRYWAAFTAQGL
ncbi:CHAT domain-containing protein [Dapis sp. BLCC M172]|uniref:CHAT domain-containing protein n=1 Tax=Dapis sp. BLCC M172 TaxID=2975281 RepID=UPI003CF1B85A